MNALLDFVFFENARDERAVADAAVKERHVRIDRGAVAAREIVQHHNALALCFQPLSSYTPDVTGTTCNKNCHGSPVSVDREDPEVRPDGLVSPAA